MMRIQPANTAQAILIRADAGGALGTGHVMRMIALAQAWEERGGTARLSFCQCPEPVRSLAHAHGLPTMSVGGFTPGSADDLNATIRQAVDLGTSWVVLDGYHFGRDWQDALKDAGFKVLAVDDYGHCDSWSADLVLNQNATVPKTRIAVHEECRFLSGLRYALLRREFRQRIPPRPAARSSSRLLVTFGGADPSDGTTSVLVALGKLPPRGLAVKALVGPANPRLSALRVLAAASPHQTEILPATDDMPVLYQWADRVISAGGSSCYEWMLFHLPGWIVAVSDNQEEIVRVLLAEGMAAGLQSLAGFTPDDLAARLASWLDDPAPPATDRIDAWGAPRVAAHLEGCPCWVRPVDPVQDAEFLLDLANEPSVRGAGIHAAPVTRDEHRAWLARHAFSTNSWLLVVETFDRGPAGLLRFHQRSPGLWEIGISIRPGFRGAGLATRSLELGMRSLSTFRLVERWLARVKPDNAASAALFTRAGFTRAPHVDSDGLEARMLPAAQRLATP